MPRVTLRGAGLPPVLLEPGDCWRSAARPTTWRSGRRAGPSTLPDCAPHVSRLVGELEVDAERVVLHWVGAGAAQLSGLFDAPGGARRVSLTRPMSATLDDGENQLVVLLGRQEPDGGPSDIVSASTSLLARPSRAGPPAHGRNGHDRGRTQDSSAAAATVFGAGPDRPWLSGNDDYLAPTVEPGDL